MSQFTALVLTPNAQEPPVVLNIEGYKHIQSIVGGLFDLHQHVVEGSHYGDIDLSIYMCDEPHVWTEQINSRISMFVHRLIRGTVVIGGTVDADGEQLSIHPAISDAFVFAHQQIVSGTTLEDAKLKADARFN